MKFSVSIILNVFLSFWIVFFTQTSIAADIVANNYAVANTPSVKSCTAGYDVMAGDISHSQPVIDSKLPYSMQYRAPLRQNLSAAQSFLQPEDSSLGWYDNYQSSIKTLNVTKSVQQYQNISSQSFYNNQGQLRYYIQSSNPVYSSNIIKVHVVQLPGEVSGTLFKEANGGFSRLYSADGIAELNQLAIEQMNWDTNLGEYNLVRVGNSLIVSKNGTKYTVTDAYYNFGDAVSSSEAVNAYRNTTNQYVLTNASWGTTNIPAGAVSNTTTVALFTTTMQWRLSRVAKVENAGRSINLTYDANLNLTQVNDLFNNNLTFEHNYREGLLPSSQTVDESRLVTKVTFSSPSLTEQQTAEFDYQAYSTRVPSTGSTTRSFVLTAIRSSNFVNPINFEYVLKEIGALKKYIAFKGRTYDSSYELPILSLARNSSGNIGRQWDVTQNYVLNAAKTDYATAQTTLRAYTPGVANEDLNLKYNDSTTIYDDVLKSINFTIATSAFDAGSVLQPQGVATGSIQSTLSGNLITLTSTGYPCLTISDKPVDTLQINTTRSQLVTFKDRNANTTNLSYDSKNRLTSLVEAVGSALERTTTYVYDVLSDNSVNNYTVPTQVSKGTLTVTNVINPRGQLVSQTTVSSQAGSTAKTTSYTYNETVTSPLYALPISVNGPRTGDIDLISYSYDANGNLTSESQVVNGIVRATSFSGYNIWGKPTEKVYPNGILENYEYGTYGYGEITQKTVKKTANDEDPDITQYYYTPDKQVFHIQYPDNTGVTMFYNAIGLIEYKQKNNESSSYYYHSNGQLAINTISPLGSGDNNGEVIQSVQLDNNGRPLKVINGSDANKSYIINNYDANGNLIKATDANGNFESWTYDVLNRQILHTDGTGATNTTTYDLFDNVISSLDANASGSNPLVYKNINVLTSESNFDFGNKSYAYNEADILIQRSYNNRSCSLLAIDALGRNNSLSCAYSSNNNARFNVNESYLYDQSRFGNLDTVSSTNSIYGVNTFFEYNAYGLVTKKTQVDKYFNVLTGLSNNQLQVNYTYNKGNKITNLTLPSGRNIIYDYSNGAYYPYSVSIDQNLLITDLSFDGRGRLSYWTLPTSSNSSNFSNIEYTPQGDIAAMTYVGSNNTVYFSENYGYDNAGRLLSALVNNGIQYQYSYNAVARLTNERKMLAGNTVYNIAYGYDANGNRLSLNATGTHLQPAANVSYAYSNNKLSSMSKNGSSAAVAYTANHELVIAQSTPEYDSEGRRVSDAVAGASYVMNYNHKNERTLRASSTNLAAAVQYVYDENSHLIGEYNAAGPIVEYVWLGETPIAAIYGSGASTRIYYILTDSKSTPRRLVDSVTNQIVWSWDPTAFGLGDPVGSITFNLRFPGQYYDAATKQFYNLNRYYNPELGRYMEPDPIGLEGGLNPYIYAGANPVMNVDPSGLFTLGYQFPSMPEPLYNFSMGLANGISFGLAQPVSNLFYGYNTANTGSTAYKTGEISSMLTGAGGLGKSLINAGMRSADNFAIQQSRMVLPEITILRKGHDGAIGLGKYADDFIFARSSSQKFTSLERSNINEIGYKLGCHTCGIKDPGTKSGNFVPDHQRPTALNTTNAPQYLYPQCINCSRQQGLDIIRRNRSNGR